MNLYKVAVCDDNDQELNNLYHMISSILDEKAAVYEISRFMSGEVAANAIINQNRNYDILFLDILMDELNGIMTARKIREEDEDISIVFITGSPNFVFEGYDVQALNYILKPVDKKKLSEILIYDCSKRNQKNYMDVKLKNSVVRILFDETIYLESKGRRVRIITTDKEYETYGTLTQFNEILPSEQFISCHKSFVVNLNYVSQISRTYFTTACNKIIPISKARYPDSKKAFINFIGKG